MNKFGELIRAAAEKNSLNVELFASLIMQESGGKVDAWRYEPNFYRTYLEKLTIEEMQGFVPNNILLDDEKRLRSVSWGLTQILGETARELGFEGDLDIDLFDPATNLEYGAKYLAKCFARHPDEREALLAYNGGSDDTYPDRVLARKMNGEYKILL